jgi:hypothetical protein
MSEVLRRWGRGVVCECSTWNRTFGWGTWRGVRNGHCARLPARSCRIIRTLVLYHAGWPLVAYIFQLCSLVRLAPLCREKNLSDPARRVRLNSQTHGNVPAGADSDAHTVVVIAPCKCLPRTRHISCRSWGAIASGCTACQCPRSQRGCSVRITESCRLRSR